MCKVLIFSCISVAMLMATAYGASLSSKNLHVLQTLIDDLEILEKSKNVSGWFSCIRYFLFMFSTYFFYAFCSQKLTFSFSSLQKIHLDLYTPNEERECSRQTLQCYLEEMDTLEKEIEDEAEIEEAVANALRNSKKNLQILV
ncbi:UNVERIFIED_CONTAM: hypothetical protein H355_015909, partial [Colinus virginianus]